MCIKVETLCYRDEINNDTKPMLPQKISKTKIWNSEMRLEIQRKEFKTFPEALS